MNRFGNPDRNRAVAVWLFATAVIVFLMVVIGGITPPDGFGAVDHRVEAHHGRHPAAERRSVERGVRKVQTDSPIRPDQRRHESGRVPGHLLVGMAASADRSADRGGVRPAAGLLPAVPRRVAALGLPSMGHAGSADLALRGAAGPGRAAGIDRLVDGVQRPVGTGQRRARAAGDAPGPGLRPVRRPDLDRAGGLERRGPRSSARRLGAGRRFAAGSGLPAVPVGRLGRRRARRAGLYRLAADERPGPAAGRLEFGGKRPFCTIRP